MSQNSHNKNPGEFNCSNSEGKFEKTILCSEKDFFDVLQQFDGKLKENKELDCIRYYSDSPYFVLKGFRIAYIKQK